MRRGDSLFYSMREDPSGGSICKDIYLDRSFAKRRMMLTSATSTLSTRPGTLLLLQQCSFSPPARDLLEERRGGRISGKRPGWNRAVIPRPGFILCRDPVQWHHHCSSPTSRWTDCCPVCTPSIEAKTGGLNDVIVWPWSSLSLDLKYILSIVRLLEYSRRIYTPYKKRSFSSWASSKLRH
jgi:hypothetical protein